MGLRWGGGWERGSGNEEKAARGGGTGEERSSQSSGLPSWAMATDGAAIGSDAPLEEAIKVRLYNPANASELHVLDGAEEEDDDEEKGSLRPSNASGRGEEMPASAAVEEAGMDDDGVARVLSSAFFVVEGGSENGNRPGCSSFAFPFVGSLSGRPEALIVCVGEGAGGDLGHSRRYPCERREAYHMEEQNSINDSRITRSSSVRRGINIPTNPSK